MRTLSKESREYILSLLNENVKIDRIISFCEGLGLDVTNYSSPVHYSNGKLAIKYRRSISYYYL